MAILIETVKTLMARDLAKLRAELNAYPSDDAIWKLDGSIKNTAGNLCLHICGNLQHYIGKQLGNSSYVRHREAEFSSKGLSREALIKEVEATAQIVDSVLSALPISQIENVYPEMVFDKPMTTGYFLIHLAGHLNYHLGQINYHRRLLN